MKRKRSSRKVSLDNVITFPIKNKRANRKMKVFTCQCGSQLFYLCEGGGVFCQGCRSTQNNLSFRFT